MQNKKYFYPSLTVIFVALLVVLGWVYLVYGTTIGTDIETVNFLATGTSTLATTTIGTNFYIDETGNASTTGAVIFGSTLSVTSDTTLSGNVLIVGTSTLATTTIGTNFYIDETGNASTTGLFIVGDATTLSNNLSVSGTSTLTNLSVSGTSTLSDVTTIGTNFYIDASGNASSTGYLYLGNGAFYVDTSGNASTTGDFSAANASTTGTLTIGSGTAINKLMFGTVAIDPGAIATSTTVLTNVTVTGLTADMKCFIQPPDILNDDLIPKGATSTTDTLGVYLYNPTEVADAAAIDDGSLTWGYLCIK